MQHFAAGEGGAHGKTAAGAFEAVDFGFGDFQGFIHVLAGVQHHHSSHQLGNGSDGANLVDTFLIQNLAAAAIHNQCGLRSEQRPGYGGLGFHSFSRTAAEESTERVVLHGQVLFEELAKHIDIVLCSGGQAGQG